MLLRLLNESLFSDEDEMRKNCGSKHRENARERRKGKDWISDDSIRNLKICRKKQMSTGNATMDYDMAQVRYDEGMDAISTRKAQSERLTDFIKALKKQDGLSANLMAFFGENMVEHVTVSKQIAITFRNDIETGVIYR